jgi:hypothetical protein
MKIIHIKCIDFYMTKATFLKGVTFEAPIKKKPDIQDVPLATEPGISSIILPLMRILQRNLKRTYTYTNTDEQQPYFVGILSQTTER